MSGRAVLIVCFFMKRKTTILIITASLTVLMAFVCLFVGSSNMSIAECFSALFGKGSQAGVRIMQNIRLPRVLAAVIAGAGLSVSGLVMQTTLNNSMASPSTLGITNAAVFGANVSIIAFAGGFLKTGHDASSFMVGTNPYATSAVAFIFAVVSVLLIMGLGRIRSFSPGVLILSGIAMGSVWTAATTILQFYSTDIGLSAAVIWSFGDLGRATYETDAIIAVVLVVSVIFFSLMSWKYNALLFGDETAVSLGINVKRLRFISLLMSSLLTAVCVSFLGIIGFVGIICPHISKRLIGNNHKVSIPLSALTGSVLLLMADTASRIIGSGSALPVGAITALLGAPFFVALILGRRKYHA